MKKYWRLTVRDEFSAAHALRHYEGKCENPHGHNFAVEVVLKGDRPDEKTGMLLDFKILKNLLRKALAGFDHKMLNNEPPFDTLNPSSENMAREIWLRMDALLKSSPEAANSNARLCEVSVSEKASQGAAYCEEG